MFFEVKDFNFGLGRDAERGRWRGEPDGFVKAGLKFPDWAVHNHNRRALIHAQNTAKPALIADDIPGMKPERIRQGVAR